MGKNTVLLALMIMALGSSALAVPVYNASVSTWDSTNVTPGAIGGSGQINGGFVVNDGAVELALRASEYAVGPLAAARINNDVYHVDAGMSPSNANRTWWSFDWNINALDTALTMTELAPTLLFDIDPTAGQNFISLPIAASGNYGGTNQLFQESWNFGIAGLSALIDPNADAEYDFLLSVAGGHSVGMKVVVGEGAEPVVPEPATLAMLGLGLSGLAMMRRRKGSR